MSRKGRNARSPLRLGRLGRELRRRLWKADVREEVESEIDFHVEMVAKELEARGVEASDARRQAMLRFGDLGGLEDRCEEIRREGERKMRRSEYLADLAADVRYAVRQFARTPMSTAVAVLTLALGIGATTAIFSSVRGVILRPLAIEDPGRVSIVFETWQENMADVSPGVFRDWRDRNRSFEFFAAQGYANLNLNDEERPERVLAGLATADYFSVWGVAPIVGRTFAPEDDVPGAEHVVVLSYDLWSDRFGADRGIVGTAIRLNGDVHTVIGVMPESFDLGVSSERAWIPLRLTEESYASYDSHWLTVFGRLRPGVSLDRAQADIGQITEAIWSEQPVEWGVGRASAVSDLKSMIVRDVETQLWLLLGAVALVLLIACANVGNLLLARAAGRSKELSIRAALGAGRRRIIRQLITESFVLALASAVIGIVLALAAIQALLAVAPPEIPRIEETRIDAVVLAFSILTAVVSSVLFGLVPALRGARVDLQQSLRDGGRGAATVKDRARSILVAAEVALAMTLLVGAGLLLRSSIEMARVDPGFESDGLIAARVTLPEARFAAADDVRRAFEQIEEELRRMPGIEAAGASSQAPFGPGGNSNGLLPEGRAVEELDFVDARLRIVTPGYVETLGMPIRGRDLSQSDIRGALKVMIVSEELARVGWGDEDAIGKRVACCEGSAEDPMWKTIVGVVGDIRTQGLDVAPRPEFYMTAAQVPDEAWDWIGRTMTIVARGEGDAVTIIGAMRQAVGTVAPGVPLFGVTTINAAIRQSSATARFHTTLLTVLGMIGLILAAGGIYAVISYFVSRRTHEIGVRMALGANSTVIVRWMTRTGLRPVMAGLAIGVFSAVAASRLLESVLFEVRPGDPVTVTAVVVVLLGVALAAVLLPSVRATRVDPARVLDAG